MIHTGTIHTVKQGLHEHPDIHVTDSATGFFDIGFFRQHRNLGDDLMVKIFHIVIHLQGICKFRIQQLLSRCKIGHPWKSIGCKQIFPVEPWISAKYFIGTFPGQHNLIVFRYQLTEIQQG